MTQHCDVCKRDLPGHFVMGWRWGWVVRWVCVDCVVQMQPPTQRVIRIVQP